MADTPIDHRRADGRAGEREPRAKRPERPPQRQPHRPAWGLEAVADAPHRLDERLVERLVDDLADAPHVGVDHVRPALGGEVPHVLDHVGPA